MQSIGLINGLVVVTHLPTQDALNFLIANYPGADCFLWDGSPVNIGDADPRPVDDQHPNYTATQQAIPLMSDASDPVVYGVTKWLELFGDWLNALQFASNGTTRTRQDLVNEWVSRMKGTYTPH